MCNMVCIVAYDNIRVCTYYTYMCISTRSTASGPADEPMYYNNIEYNDNKSIRVCMCIYIYIYILYTYVYSYDV